MAVLFWTRYSLKEWIKQFLKHLLYTATKKKRKKKGHTGLEGHDGE